jgi:hypothetical protein
MLSPTILVVNKMPVCLAGYCSCPPSSVISSVAGQFYPAPHSAEAYRSPSDRSPVARYSSSVRWPRSAVCSPLRPPSPRPGRCSAPPTCAGESGSRTCNPASPLRHYQLDNSEESCSDREMVKSLGWKVYENRISNPIEERWMAFLVREEQRILARAPTSKQSWMLAASMVE